MEIFFKLFTKDIILCIDVSNHFQYVKQFRNLVPKNTDFISINHFVKKFVEQIHKENFSSVITKKFY